MRTITLYDDGSLAVAFVLMFIWFYGCDSCGANTPALGPPMIHYLESNSLALDADGEEG